MDKDRVDEESETLSVGNIHGNYDFDDKFRNVEYEHLDDVFKSASVGSSSSISVAGPGKSAYDMDYPGPYGCEFPCEHYEADDGVARALTAVERSSCYELAGGNLAADAGDYQYYQDSSHGMSYANLDTKGMTSGLERLHVDTNFPFDSNYSHMPIYIPLVPTVLLPSHFKTCRPVNEVVDAISGSFKKLKVSYEFQSNTAEFNAVLVKSSTYTKFQVHIYVADPSGNDLGNEKCEKIVESQRFCGDGFAFNAIIGAMRGSVLNEKSADEEEETTSNEVSSRSSSMAAATPTSTSPKLPEDYLTAPLTMEEQAMFLEPIRRMVQTGASMESQLEGCRLMSDLIVSNTNFHSQLLDFGCVEMLVRLSLSSNFLTCQQAILALGELSNSTADASTGTRCVQLIWDAVHDNAEQYGKFVDLLCAQVTDGPYYTECRRRQGAQLLVTMLEHSLKHHEAACGSLTSSAASSTAASSARVNIEKYRRHLAVVNDRIVTPRSAKGKNMGGATGFPQSLSATPANSSGSAASRQSSYGAYAVPSYAGPGEPLQDAQLEQCASAIASYMERICPSSA